MWLLPASFESPGSPPPPLINWRPQKVGSWHLLVADSCMDHEKGIKGHVNKGRILTQGIFILFQPPPPWWFGGLVIRLSAQQDCAHPRVR